MAGMIDRLKKQDEIDMVLRNLQPRFTKCLVGIPFQDLKSLVHAVFSVKEVIAQELWTNIAHSPDSKGNKLVGSSRTSGEVATISYQHQRPAHHSPYRPPTVRAHLSHLQYQYHPVYVQRSLTLLRLACNHDHHIRESLLSSRLDHTHRGPRDSSLHWA